MERFILSNLIHLTFQAGGKNMKEKKGFFDYEGGFHRMTVKIMDVVLANLLFLLCSIPIITIGASSVAMHTLLLKCQQGEDISVCKTFFHSFRENFKKATLVWCGILIILVTLWLNVSLLNQLQSSVRGIIQGFFAVILLLILVLWIYLFPAMAYFENTVMGYLQYAFSLAIAHLPEAALLFVLQLAAVVLFLLSLQIFPLAVLVLLLCLFSLPAYLSDRVLIRMFQPQPQLQQ